MRVVKHQSRLSRNTVGTLSLVIYRTCLDVVLGNLLLLSLLEQSGRARGSQELPPSLSHSLVLAPLSGTVRALYRILKWRSARIYQMKVDWEGMTALCFLTLSFGGKNHFTISASGNTMSDTKCIVQPFYGISLLFHVPWASSIILVLFELFCAFDYIWCTYPT